LEEAIMEEEKTLLDLVDSSAYDAADKPFDFVEAEGETALICESDPAIAEKISAAVKSLGYMITEAGSAKDALKKMRFHTYDVVVLDERFDTAAPDENDVLRYLESLSMVTRRDIFVALVSERFRSMDNMAAFNKSVNLVINTKNIDDVETILKRGVSENNAFYRVFKETLKKMGRG
jgi:CheY-like chemotaxis protein